jgi:beta-glucanase (GH16 family)
VPEASVPPLPGWALTWSDEFDRAAGTPPDASKWVADTGGNGWLNQELEYYTAGARNAAHDGRGHLAIVARAEVARPETVQGACWYGACRYTSARLKTLGKFAQAYGRFEARIRIPEGQGIWPAFWMMGNDIERVGWPRNGEIDVMEAIGRDPNVVYGSIHGPDSTGGTSARKLARPLAEDFHVYAVEWEPDEVRWFVDGERYRTTTRPASDPKRTWVYDHPFFLLLNVAVGGSWPGAPDASTTFPQQMLVDYVRVYSKR